MATRVPSVVVTNGQAGTGHKPAQFFPSLGMGIACKVFCYVCYGLLPPSPELGQTLLLPIAEALSLIIAAPD